MATTSQADDSSKQPKPERRPTLTLFTPGIPWYRDVRVLRAVAQLIFVIFFVGALYLLINNLVTNLSASNLSLDFGVYKRPFNVAIPEGLSATDVWTWAADTTPIAWILWGLLVGLTGWSGYRAFRQYRRGHLQWQPVLLTLILLFLVVTSPPDALAASLSTMFTDYFYPSSMARAFVTGVYNTLQVVFFSLIACTLVGVFVGIGLLSSNLLVRGLAAIYVEIFRNTPLVVQLIFVYRTLTLLLPAPRQSIFGPAAGETGSYWIMNARGIYLPRLVPTPTTDIFWLVLLVGLVIAWGVRRWRLHYADQTGAPARALTFSAGILLATLVVAWLLAAGSPYTVNFPLLRGPNVQEGMQLSISFVAVFVGLTLYTAAFIADIVRAGIQSVSYGQIEAARSLGLQSGQVLSMVVLPQALRLIIPPLGNQYVNLGKNSSLALVVGYIDVYRIAQIANNESGQAVPFFLALMLIYLVISLTLSLLTNLLNQSTRLKTR